MNRINLEQMNKDLDRLPAVEQKILGIDWQVMQVQQGPTDELFIVHLSCFDTDAHKLRTQIVAANQVGLDEVAAQLTTWGAF
jgi:hypothetical protein